jgi:hypothetical protein
LTWFIYVMNKSSHVPSDTPFGTPARRWSAVPLDVVGGAAQNVAQRPLILAQQGLDQSRRLGLMAGDPFHVILAFAGAALLAVIARRGLRKAEAEG